jgi:four helix bundle suffix protein
MGPDGTAIFLRSLGRNIIHGTEETYEIYKPFIETRSPEVVANIIICLIHQTKYLLDRQLRQLEVAFLKEGGLREQMTRARLDSRKSGGK